MAGNRRTTWLGAVLAVLIVVALWLQTGASTVPPALPRTVGQTQVGQTQSGGRASDGAAPTSTAVRLDSLQADRQAPGASARNPFRFGVRVAPPPPPPTSVFVPADSAPTLPVGPPPPPPITLKFIGTVEKAGGFKVAVLSGGTYPLYGREGEIIDGRYRILKIGEESLEIAYLDGRGRQTIRLSGQ